LREARGASCPPEGDFVPRLFGLAGCFGSREERSMGRGDKRTRRGKIARHSFGKSRPKATKPAAVKKTVKAVKKKAAR
jgi:ribosomal small subunit protein bTHX